MDEACRTRVSHSVGAGIQALWYHRVNVMEKQRGSSRGLNNPHDILSYRALPNPELVDPLNRVK